MAGYLKREAMLFKGMDRAIAAAAPGTTPRVLDIGANHGLVAIVAALRGARVAAVEAQATLASLVKVSSLANGVDIDVFHNAVLDVPAVVEICVEIKIVRRVRAESSRRPPRHRRDACSMAWRCRFLTARRSQDGRAIAAR